jgi:hypothetical protein
MYKTIKNFAAACCIMAVCNTAKAQTVNVNSGYNSSYNLIMNGDFERKSGGWMLPITAPVDVSSLFINGEGRDAIMGIMGAGAKLTPTTPNSFSQEIVQATRQGDTLNFSFWYKYFAAANEMTGLTAYVLYADPADNTNVSFDLPAAANYTQVTRQLIVPKNIQKLVIIFSFFSMGAGNSNAVIDDVFLGLKPLPATVTGITGGGTTGGTSSQWATVSPTRINYANQVAIGGTKFYNDNSYKLSVNGKMVAEEVLVELNSTWPDYVFDSAYQLKPIEEVAAFITKNKHLPGLPSQQQMHQAGTVPLGEMNRKLLEKVEELTLYIIELKKEMELLKAKSNQPVQ